MEIDKLRQELNDLLENIVEHSESYSKNRPIPSLEVSYVLSKVNKMQETLIVLKHLLKEEEINSKKRRVERQNENTPEIIAPVSPEEQIQKEVDAALPHQEPELTQDPAVEEVKENEVKEVETSEPVSTTKPNIERMPIAKLVDAFTLNDRYLYANELFEKDMNAFNECVKGLDACTSIDEAKGILSNLAAENNWEEENVHVESFHELVERRFL